MGNRARIAFAALAGASAVTAGAVVFAGASAAVGPAPAPIVQAAQATCVTDGNGFCTVTHGLGTVPEAVVVSPNTPSAFNAFTLNTVLGSYTATTFQVRAMFTQTTPKTFGQIWFTYAAYGAAATPPTTTPKTTTPPPETTTPPPPTTTTSPRTDTTTPAGGGG
ncbi:hypothetical protein [Amycolatopsis sp. WQ 127309]|uniref:hypothetical protein n=1 Tax=Amycolatopsis sp. WQ 127309 TaxID=2932773 RepID=UPI001FF2FBA8|nr:hypothetical protein [Amycolatopsis sp. WQ 127309]UOZ06318.1 hypothetical protein MUY22_47250 [Amycolatopsis sp. WQ 127309]